MSWPRSASKVAASTVWEILKDHGIDPSSEREHTTWSDFLRGQANALLACGLFEVRTLMGARHYVLAVIEYATHIRDSRWHCAAHESAPVIRWRCPPGEQIATLEAANDWLDRERDNLLAALRQAARTTDSAAAGLANAVQWLYDRRGWFAEVVEVSQEPLRLAREAEDWPGAAYVLQGLRARWEWRDSRELLHEARLLAPVEVAGYLAQPVPDTPEPIRNQL
ncbi:hypothetical protein AB0J35_61915 [Nonomuraea angiospora]|uniref:hypothetical protein n=1 Tax=Nonomuraea angiospora TaxID=46172 RepID=UPI003413ADEB